MPYIGKQLVRGQNRELDDISSSFNGATTTFNLTVAGDSVTPGSALQLFISIGGVLQNPNTDFTVAGNQITFSTAPGSGLSFFGYLQGDAVDFNTPADGSVTTAKLGSNLTINVADGSAATPSIQFNGSGTDTGFYSPAADEIAITEGGSEALRIDSSGRLLVGTSTPIASTTTALVQSNSQVIAPQGVSTGNGGWSMLPTNRVTLTVGSGGITGHTVQINLAGLNGVSDSTLIRVSFAMRRGNSSTSFSQKSDYMGLWHATKISTDEHIAQSHIVTREMTVVSASYTSDVITFTFDTDNVRSFTARAFEYCTTGTSYVEA